jgi:N-alpha-acetyltransferase 30
MSKQTTKGASGKKQQQQQQQLVEELDAAVRQIELSEGKSLKKGMTKAQTLQAIEKMQRDAEAKQTISSQEAELQRRTHSEQIKNLLASREEEKRRLILESKYVNVEVALTAEYTQWKKVADKRWVRFEQFDRTNEQMAQMVTVFNSELSEPYNSFTYQFFVFGWPDLAILAFGLEQDEAPAADVKGNFVGAVVSRVTRKGPNQPLRGYVAMLAVTPSFRGARVGSQLVAATVALMTAKGCDEVSLETPVSNQRALKLYTDLGFCKIKFLPVYYLDGSDAFRLKLFLNDFVKMAAAAGAAAPTVDDDESAVPALEEQARN